MTFFVAFVVGFAVSLATHLLITYIVSKVRA